jgi:hypothetical protein
VRSLAQEPARCADHELTTYPLLLIVTRGRLPPRLVADHATRRTERGRRSTWTGPPPESAPSSWTTELTDAELLCGLQLEQLRPVGEPAGADQVLRAPSATRTEPSAGVGSSLSHSPHDGKTGSSAPQNFLGSRLQTSSLPGPQPADPSPERKRPPSPSSVPEQAPQALRLSSRKRPKLQATTVSPQGPSLAVGWLPAASEVTPTVMVPPVEPVKPSKPSRRKRSLPTTLSKPEGVIACVLRGASS